MTLPTRPLDEAPLASATVPLRPLPACPVDSATEPLLPAVAASADAIRSAPLDAEVLAPLASTMDPPCAELDCPLLIRPFVLHLHQLMVCPISEPTPASPFVVWRYILRDAQRRVLLQDLLILALLTLCLRGDAFRTPLPGVPIIMAESARAGFDLATHRPVIVTKQAGDVLHDARRPLPLVVPQLA